MLFSILFPRKFRGKLSNLGAIEEILDEISPRSLSSSNVPLSRIQVLMDPGLHLIVSGPDKGTYARVQLPPGYCFTPKDHELINAYLKKIVYNEPAPYNCISTVNVYKYSPRNLSEAYRCLNYNVWYFYAPIDLYRKRLYRRVSNYGYWKYYGTRKQIYHNDVRIGFKKFLIFYEGEPPYGRETIWVMKEYTVDQSSTQQSVVVEDYVVCQIRMRTRRTPITKKRRDRSILFSKFHKTKKRKAYNLSKNNYQGDHILVRNF